MADNVFIVLCAGFVPLLLLLPCLVSQVSRYIRWRRSVRVTEDLRGLRAGETLLGVMDRKHRPSFYIGRAVKEEKPYE